MISARGHGRGASSRRGRSSTASMSKISPARRSRASSIMRSRGPSMSATTSPVRRRMLVAHAASLLAWSRRARCRLRRRSSPKWRAASMRRTSAAPTGGSRNGSATAFAIRPTARGWLPSRRPADSGRVLGGAGCAFWRSPNFSKNVTIPAGCTLPCSLEQGRGENMFRAISGRRGQSLVLAGPASSDTCFSGNDRWSTQ